MKNKQPVIIPVASGKGGVGKSVLSANLSISLARLGYSVVAVDLDFGASNLNTYLGMPNNYPGIGDYLKARSMRFTDLPVQTGVNNLKFIPGDGRIPFMANISYDQRHMLVKGIKHLSADYVILDLGAGSQFNTLNFFGLSQTGLILTTFETPAIMNFVMFLRNFVLREISSSVHQNNQVVELLKAEYNQSMNDRPLTVRSLTGKIKRIDPGMAMIAEKAASRFIPRVVFNMADTPDDLAIVPKIDSTLKHGLSMGAEFFGCVFYDETVRSASRKKEVLVLDHPDCIASKSIRFIAERIAGNRGRAAGLSIDSLMGTMKGNFTEWKHQRPRLQ